MPLDILTEEDFDTPDVLNESDFKIDTPDVLTEQDFAQPPSFPFAQSKVEDIETPDVIDITPVDKISEFGEIREQTTFEQARDKMKTVIDFYTSPYKRAGKKLGEDLEKQNRGIKLVVTRPDLILDFNKISNLPEEELMEVY